jgi:hypothetical protein
VLKRCGAARVDERLEPPIARIKMLLFSPSALLLWFCSFRLRKGRANRRSHQRFGTWAAVLPPPESVVQAHSEHLEVAIVGADYVAREHWNNRPRNHKRAVIQPNKVVLGSHRPSSRKSPLGKHDRACPGCLDRARARFSRGAFSGATARLMVGARGRPSGLPRLERLALAGARQFCPSPSRFASCALSA